MKKRVIQILFAVVFLSLVIAVIWFVNRKNNSDIEDPELVLEVNDERVYLSEAMVYFRLMQLEYEAEAGKEVWDLNMLGFDAKQTAIDRTLESIIRIKVVQPLAGTVKNSEYQTILEKSNLLEMILGEAYMETYGIDRELIETIVLENFLAYRYAETASFRSSDFETQISEMMEMQYGVYDTIDQEKYLSSITIIPMMFYTGQFTEGVWVSYPETQKEQIYNTVLAVYDLLDKETFYSKALYLADSISTEGNPVFEQGAVRCEYMKMGRVYYGQMITDTADALFATEVGEISGIIATEYGYLICLVTAKNDPFDYDFEAFRDQLLLAKNSYRAEMINELKKQRLEEEWDRLEQESIIVRHRETLSEFVSQ